MELALRRWGVPDWWRTRLGRELIRLRSDGRAALLWSLRITVAAVASYVVGTLFFPGTQPLLAPLTAMLVVQVTPVSLLASGIDRVVAVVAGVFVAVAFSAGLPLRWWSLGLLIFVSITIGQALRLRANLIEVAISGMLVLGVGSLGAESAAWQRIAETLVGAAVGVAANLLFPPKVASADAGRAIYGLADSVGGLLRRAADELTHHVDDGVPLGPAAEAWLGEARRITYDIPPIGAALVQAEQGRRLNVRALGTPDVGPGLRQGLEALEHSAVALRGMFRAIVDATHDARWLEDERAPDVLLGLAQTLRELSLAVETFGRLVHGEASTATPDSLASPQDVRAALEGLHEARARLEDLVLADSDSELLVLHSAVLSTVNRLLREMDLAERIRRQIRQFRPARSRLLPPAASTPPRRPSAPPPPLADAETQLLPKTPDLRDEHGK